jgi:hypothetical protein
MTCSQCWSTIPARSEKCPRCGAKVTGAPPSFLGLLKAYPWLGVVLALSVLVTLWAATRRAPVPEVIPPAVEPVADAPAPAPEPEPDAMPVVAPFVEPEPAPIPVVKQTGQADPMTQSPDGAWKGGPALPTPPGR